MIFEKKAAQRVKVYALETNGVWQYMRTTEKYGRLLSVPMSVSLSEWWLHFSPVALRPARAHRNSVIDGVSGGKQEEKKEKSYKEGRRRAETGHHAWFWQDAARTTARCAIAE